MKRASTWHRSSSTFMQWPIAAPSLSEVLAAFQHVLGDLCAMWQFRRHDVVASSMIKGLSIDWQSGERYLMRQLLDADVTANNRNWQWCASTGTEAMRGYRIFNPVLQSKKFDPDASHIRRYVPTLDKVPATPIHERASSPLMSRPARNVISA